MIWNYKPFFLEFDLIKALILVRVVENIKDTFKLNISFVPVTFGSPDA